MSRPRKPFGANHPGRLPATMMKVLAAEMSDPSRLRRGKQYAKDGSVLDIIVEPGLVTCEIQGSRSTPYVATIAVRPGDGMPLRRDISTTCTCPDDDNWDGHACKHVVAAMFALSDELLLEPELLDLWRDRTGATTGTTAGEAHPATTGETDAPGDDRVAGVTTADRTSTPEVERGDDSGADRPRHLRLVRSPDAEAGARREHREGTDRLAPLLVPPTGAALPEIPDIDRLEPVAPRDRDLATALRDAIAHLHIEWG